MGTREEMVGAQDAITTDEWQSGKRPNGYESTSNLVHQLHDRGKRLKDCLSAETYARWNELVGMAKRSGLQAAEAAELARLSQVVSAAVKEKLESAK